MLEDLGNCVKIHDTVIPAANIQVEGFPGYHGDDWYGIYFEIAFEDGSLWVIEQLHVDSKIVVEGYPNWWIETRRLDPDNFTTKHEDWDHFLTSYQRRLAVIEFTKTITWKLYRDCVI